MISKELIEQYKQEIEILIRKNNFQTLRYELFNEQSRLPWATHLFYKDNKFIVNSRDERSCVVGKAWEYDTIDEAKYKFMSILKQIINAEHLASELGFSHPYSSPSLDKEKQELMFY